MQVEYARVLLPHVDRKLVKQTVMTSVYGVTFIGARQQIQNRLKERDLFDEDLRYKVSCYAARETLKSLDSMFSNAREVRGRDSRAQGSGWVFRGYRRRLGVGTVCVSKCHLHRGVLGCHSCGTVHAMACVAPLRPAPADPGIG